ncbi:MAG: hypothetical protein ACR2OG_17220 [Gemmatimonadaceae bacterium]
METNSTKKTEPKAPSLPDLSPTQDEAKDVKGGMGACVSGTHIKEGTIPL